jgi:UDP-glucose 4-epimerase
VPLPLGAVCARRSLVYVHNLADALMHCATSPHARGETFHVADDDVPTVTELLQRTGAYLGKPARLLAVPPAWLRALERLTGSTRRTARLTGSLQLDTRHIHATLGWRAPYSLDEGLMQTARWYRATH